MAGVTWEAVGPAQRVIRHKGPHNGGVIEPNGVTVVPEAIEADVPGSSMGINGFANV